MNFNTHKCRSCSNYKAEFRMQKPFATFFFLSFCFFFFFFRRLVCFPILNTKFNLTVANLHRAIGLINFQLSRKTKLFDAKSVKLITPWCLLWWWWWCLLSKTYILLFSKKVSEKVISLNTTNTIHFPFFDLLLSRCFAPDFFPFTFCCEHLQSNWKQLHFPINQTNDDKWAKQLWAENFLN